MTEAVPIAAPLDPDDEAKVRDFTARNGAPASLALVIMSDVRALPLSYRVLSWTPGEDRPPKVVVQSTAAALLQASIAKDMIKAPTE